MTTPALTITDRIPDATALGTSISDATTCAEALAAADLNWGLQVSDAGSMTILTDDGVSLTGMPDRRFVSRDDTGTILAAVGSRYTPISNAQVFALSDHAKALGACFDAAGALDHGRTVFMTMTIPEATGFVGGSDPVEFGFYLRSGHDGQAATYSVSATRRVCTNGMVVGNLDATPQSWTIRHTSSAYDNLVLAKAAVTDAMAYAKAFVAHADAMVTTPMTTGEYIDVLDAIAPKPDYDNKAAVTRWERRRDILMDLWGTADTQENIRNTRWAAFNAIGEYLDWYTTTKGDDAVRARALRQFNGTDTATRRRAFQLLAAA